MRVVFAAQAIASVASGIALAIAVPKAYADQVPASAPVVVDGVAYSLDLVYANAGSILDRIKQAPWFSKTGSLDDINSAIDLAVKFSQALNPPGTSVLYDKAIGCTSKNTLNTTSRYGEFCPYFVYNTYPGAAGLGTLINIVTSPFERDVYPAINTSFNYVAKDVYGYFALAGTATASPIVSQGNVVGGNGLNKTSNLSVANLLLPSFEGGTLTVDTASIGQNFTLSSSSGNGIDAAGFNATFSGVFANASSASAGSIRFQDSIGSGAITLTGNSTYTGLTRVDQATTLKLAGDGSIGSSQYVANNGLIDISGITSRTTFHSLAGTGDVLLGAKTLDLLIEPANRTAVFKGSIKGDGNVSINGLGRHIFEGNNTFIGSTTINPNARLLLSGSSQSPTTVLDGGMLAGTGIIHASVTNLGTVSPGWFIGETVPPTRSAIGTLTVDGNYGQLYGGTLRIDVDGSSSDLLRLEGSGRVIILGGNLDIESVPGTSITPGIAYTAVDVPQGTQGGEASLQTKLGVVGSSGYDFVRETDPRFSALKGGEQCKGVNDPTCTKLQFGWIQKQAVIDPSPSPTPGPTPSPTIPTTLNPGTQSIGYVKDVGGGAITQAAAGNPTTNEKTCSRNSGNAQACKSINTPGSGITGSTNNNTGVAKVLDGGSSSVQAAVQQGITGGQPIPTPSGDNSGYTTNQTTAALVTPDFVNVIGALNALSTRQDLNTALHSLSAEPYASMQSVALEALRQFRMAGLATGTNSRSIPLSVEESACTSRTVDNSIKKQSSTVAPSVCAKAKQSHLARWSLLLDGTNTQAALKGTDELSSLDYNIFSSSYGLQYKFSPQWSAGASFGYGQANLYNYEYANATINSSTYSASIWGVYRPSDAWRFSALAGYMNLQYNSQRNIDFGGLSRTANANWTGNGFTAAIAAEYDWVLDSNKASRSAVRIKPNTYLSYALHSQGAFSESGAGALNLAVDSHTADSLIYGVGFQVETPIVTGKASRLIPRISLGYEYDFNGNSNQEHQITSSFAEVPALGSIDALGQNRGANAMALGLSLEYETSQLLSFYAGVGGSFWSNGNEINYGGGVRLRW